MLVNIIIGVILITIIINAIIYIKRNRNSCSYCSKSKQGKKGNKSCCLNKEE